MITIRQLTEADLPQAIQLKAVCWPEELAGLADAELDVQQQLQFWVNWMQAAEKDNDVRLPIGAFENGRMLGVAFASLAETDDIADGGIELNGLWVHPGQRGRGLGLQLLAHVLGYYQQLGRRQVVIYSFHCSPSNSFYRRFRAQVLRQEVQTKERLPVDVFIADIGTMQGAVESALQRYI
ncbi:MAG: GNAT family N-acetyltransferase [Bacillota bacterium]|jgi:GNAT superfamily N-acetyltransferase